MLTLNGVMAQARNHKFHEGGTREASLILKNKLSGKKSEPLSPIEIDAIQILIASVSNRPDEVPKTYFCDADCNNNKKNPCINNMAAICGESQGDLELCPHKCSDNQN